MSIKTNLKSLSVERLLCFFSLHLVWRKFTFSFGDYTNLGRNRLRFHRRRENSIRRLFARNLL